MSPRRHSRETKALISRKVKLAWQRRRDNNGCYRDEDVSIYYRRYKNLCNIVKSLRGEIERRDELDAAWLPDKSILVRTCGPCTPANGNMLWAGGGFALVWFVGSNAPVVWQASNIEVAERCADAAE